MSSNNIPNYQELIPKEFRKKDFGVNERLGINKLFRMILLSPSGGGKTNMVFHVLRNSPHVYAHLHIIAKNPDQPLYDYIKEKLQHFATFYDPEAPPSVDSIKEIPNALQLVIIDDYSNEKKLQRDLFSAYFIRGRHHNISTIFLTHSYFATDKLIRLNSEYIAILKANSRRDLRLILTDFNLSGVSEDDIYRYYKESTKNHGQALLINSLNGTVRSNFNGKIFNGKRDDED